MKNNAVLKKFLTYVAIAAVSIAGSLSIVHQSEKMFGNPMYGWLAIFVVLGLFWLWTMADQQVSSEERQKRWDKEEELRKKEREILKG